MAAARTMAARTIPEAHMLMEVVQVGMRLDHIDRTGRQALVDPAAGEHSRHFHGVEEGLEDHNQDLQEDKERMAAGPGGEPDTVEEAVGGTVKVALAVEGTNHHDPSHWLLVGDILAVVATALAVHTW